MSFGTAGLIFVAYLGYFGLTCFRHYWAADFQMYCAGAARLYTNLLAPEHEALALPGDTSSLYTPYLVLVSALGVLFDVTPYRALEYAGMVNLIVYMLAILYFFSRHSLHYRFQLAAACFLAASLLLRWTHFGWSSELSLANLQYVQAYPSTLGWSLALVAFGLVEELRRRGSWSATALLALTFALLLTCHVLTGSWAIGVVALYGLYDAAAKQQRRLLIRVVVAIALAFGLAVLWPYSPFLGQGPIANIEEPSVFGEHPLADMPNLYLVALPCAAWVLSRVRRHRFWVLGFCATYGVLLMWRALGVSFGNRYAFFMAFFAQFYVAEVAALGLVVLTKGRPSLRVAFQLQKEDRLVVVACLAVALIGVLPSPMLQEALREGSIAQLHSPAELLSMPSPHDAYYRRNAELRPYLGPKDIVVAPNTRDVFDIAATTGARFICSPGAIRVVDVWDRMRAASHFFAPRVGRQARLTIAKRYDATKILLPRSLWSELPALSRQFGAPLYRGTNWVVFALPSF